MIKNRTKIFGDSRVSRRISDNQKVAWTANNGEIKGRGRIRNISSSGMLLETASYPEGNDYSTLDFDADLGSSNYVPRNGRLVWYRKEGLLQSRYYCGIQFQNPSEFVTDNLKKRVETGVNRFEYINVLTYIFDVVLSVGLVALCGYLMWESSSIYRDLKTTNQRMLSVASDQAVLNQRYSAQLKESQEQLVLVQGELDQVKIMFSQNQNLLTGVQQELMQAKNMVAETGQLLAEAKLKNEQLQNQMRGISADNEKIQAQLQNLSKINEERVQKLTAEFEKQIIDLQEKNFTLGSELSDTQAKLSYLQGNVRNIPEGRELIKTYRQKLRLVKQKINVFKGETKKLRDSAQNERDRIKLIVGNNGYFMKDGEAVDVDFEKYNSIDKSPVESVSDQEPASKKVDVDVTIVD